MAYKVTLKPAAQKDLDSLPDKEVLRISNRIQTLCDNPRPIGVQKLTDAEGHRIRVGNYRVLYEIDDKAKIIFVYRVKHRSEAYR